MKGAHVMSEPENEVKERELDDEEAEKAFAEDERSVATQMKEAIDPEAAATAPPDWATVPQGMKMPEEGTQIAFIEIPSHWTRTPMKGNRTCCCWPINETEERLAYQRCRGDSLRSMTELAKATLRIVDGNKADWSGKVEGAGSVTQFWKDIGPKGRSVIRNYYIRTHTLTEEESLDFFSKHFVSVTVTRA